MRWVVKKISRDCPDILASLTPLVRLCQLEDAIAYSDGPQGPPVALLSFRSLCLSDNPPACSLVTPGTTDIEPIDHIAMHDHMLRECRARNKAEGVRIRSDAQAQAATDAARAEARRQSELRANAETAAANAVLQVSRHSNRPRGLPYHRSPY